MTGPPSSHQLRLALGLLLAVCVALSGTGCVTASRATTDTPLETEPVAEATPTPESEPEPARATPKAERPKASAKRARPRPAPEVKPEGKTPVAARVPELKRPQAQDGTSEPIPFEPSVMTRPERLSGREPQLTPEARAERVRGTALIRCVVTREGRVTGCRPLNSLPHMEQELLEALSTWRVTPILVQGKPVDVDYTFVVRIPSG
jgi:periplasmic protein TonB